MDSLEEIGALLGFVAFVGLAVLVFLTFQQARHLRRLRDWAGRAPERAAAEAAREAGQDVPAEAEADEFLPRGERDVPLETDESRWVHLREELRVRWAEWDRRSPVDLKLLLGGIAAIVVGLGIATSGFGLLGGDDSTGTQTKAGKERKRAKKAKEEKPAAPDGEGAEVAVLNGTAPAGGTGVPGVADKVSRDVEGAGFTVGAVDNAGSFTSSVIMFSGDAQSDAEELAAAMEGLLGPVEVVEMTPDIEALVEGADIALIVGQDDSTI